MKVGHATCHAGSVTQFEDQQSVSKMRPIHRPSIGMLQPSPIRFRARAHGHQMDFISDVAINLLAHRIGSRVLAFLSGGRFQGERGFAWGFAVAVGGLMLIVPLVAFIAWMIHTGS